MVLILHRAFNLDLPPNYLAQISPSVCFQSGRVFVAPPVKESSSSEKDLAGCGR